MATSLKERIGIKVKLEIQGIIVPILTPMDKRERLNEKEMRAHIERMLDAGVNGIFCLGTNGEGYALTAGEKRRIIDICVDHVNGRVPVYAGTGCVTTAETIKLSRYARNAGADALSIITPFFASITQEQLYNHYRAISESVDLPIILYNIPARTGVTITPETFSRLIRLSGIVGVKDSSGDADIMLQYIDAAKGTGAVVLSGNDSLILRNLMAGGAGGIAGCANVYPRTVVRIYQAYLSGDMEAAQAAQQSLVPLRKCFDYGNPNTVIKAAVQLLGHPVGNCRKPFDGLCPQGMEMLAQVLKRGMEGEKIR